MLSIHVNTEREGRNEYAKRKTMKKRGWMEKRDKEKREGM